MLLYTARRQNRRKSQLRRLQNHFLGCFSGFRGLNSRVFDRNPLIRIPYLSLSSWVMSRVIDSAIGASGDTKSTDHDTKSTGRDILTTLGDTFTTFGDTSAHVAKVDLRRIALDFLTCGNRVGEPKIGILLICRKSDMMSVPSRISWAIAVWKRLLS